MKKTLIAYALLALAPLGYAQVAENARPDEQLDATPRAASTWLAPQAVLVNQGPLTNQLNGTTPISVLTTAAPFNYCTLGVAGVGAFRLAEDFVVPTGTTWTVDSITVFGYQTGATTASINSANLQIFNGSPAVAGSTVLFGDTTTNRLASSTLTGAFRVTSTALTGTTRQIQAVKINVSPALTLAPGTYWFDFAAAGSSTSGPFFPFIVPAEATPTDNGTSLQFNATWNPLAMNRDPTGVCNGASVLVGPLQGLPFIVEGTAGAANISPAVTPAPINFGQILTGSAAPTRALTFNNTGSAAGTVSCSATGAGFSVTPASQTIAPAGNSAFTVSASTATAGALTGTLTCTTPGAGPFVYALSAVVGTPSFASITAGPINFGNLTVGLGFPRQLTFANTGTIAATLTCAVNNTTGTGFSVTPTGAQTIAVGGSSTFTLVALGSAANQQLAGTLTCTAPGVANSPFVFALSGSTSPVTNIPTLSSIGTLALILMLGGLAVFVIRRQA